MKYFLYFIFLLVFMPFAAQAGTVTYDIDIAVRDVNFTGHPVQALTVGGGIPGPTIEATVGDILHVTFHNKMDVETSIHWHGVLLPNDQDGVPYLTTQPIAAHSSFTYEFPIRHSGTYWYHSHTGLQEQRGVYGALVFHPKNGERVKADQDKVLVFSDWTDKNPHQVLHNLKKDGDYYALKKDTVQSWLKVIQHGMGAIENRLDGAWMRMGPMDISDVGYDAFLANGQPVYNLPDIKGGQTVRLRLIDAAASSYFNIRYAGGPMKIVAADGVDVQPVSVNKIRNAIAETWDVIVTLPDDGRSYELRATSEDGTGYASVILGTGPLVKAPDMPRPDPFAMNMHGMMMGDMSNMDDMGDMSDMPGMEGMDHSHMDHAMMDHSKMDHMAMGHSMTGMEQMAGPQDMHEYELLKAIAPTTYDTARPVREIPLTLTGNMESYTWSFNNKTLNEADKILIHKGEVVRFVMKNETMMHHPIHLHGHFFRVLNGQGDYSPLKHTVNVPAMGSVTIEFAADEEKDWFFHCHNLYHMMSGMARVISYEGTTQAGPDTLAKISHDNDWFFFADLGAQSNMVMGNLRARNTRNAFNIEYDWDYDDSHDIDAIYERRLTRFLDLYTGANFAEDNGDVDNRAIAGFHYLLPLMIESDWRIDNKGHGRLELGSNLQLTDRAAFMWKANTDREYRLQFEYDLSKQIVLTGGRDSDYGWGAGIMLKF